MMSDFKYEINDGKATITDGAVTVPRVEDLIAIQDPEDLIWRALGMQLKFYGKGESING